MLRLQLSLVHFYVFFFPLRSALLLRKISPRNMSQGTFKFQVCVMLQSTFRFLTLPGHSRLLLQFLVQCSWRGMLIRIDPAITPLPFRAREIRRERQSSLNVHLRWITSQEHFSSILNSIAKYFFSAKVLFSQCLERIPIQFLP